MIKIGKVMIKIRKIMIKIRKVMIKIRKVMVGITRVMATFFGMILVATSFVQCRHFRSARTNSTTELIKAVIF